MTQYPSEREPESEQRDDFTVMAELVSEPATGTPGRPRNRLSIGGIVSWLVVIAITVGIIALVATTQQVVSETVGGDATSGDLLQVQLAGKMLVGQKELMATVEQVPGTEAEIETIEEAIDGANRGTFEQQLACVVLTNELLGADEALEMLSDLDERVIKHDFKPSENQSILHDGVTNIVNACVDDSFDDATLSIEEEELLGEKMGWIGRLATVPAASGKTVMREEVVSEAMTSAVIASLAFLGGVVALLAGFVLAVRTIRSWKQGEFEGRFDNREGVHNIYIETFAIWLVYFVGIQLAIEPLVDAMEFNPLVVSPVIMFSSLIALVWPVIRGIPFSQVRQDIGWTSTKPLQDFFAAPVGYLATIPLVLITLLVILSVSGLGMQSGDPAATEEFSRGQTVSHPIQEYVSNADGYVVLWVILSACVAAPIVEETVFRGILYRHLRDVTAHWRVTATVAFSSLVNAFIFAAIHPQGVMLIPVLGSLAVGFSLMREWRRSLYPSMIMHAIHNGLVTCLMFTIL